MKWQIVNSGKMKPKLEFRYSRVYDDRFRKNFESKNEKYPSIKKIIAYKRGIEKIWKKEGNKILLEISKVSGLKWKEEKIICYVIGKGRSFSDPLTIRIYSKLNEFVDTLIHELIHQIQTQNYDNKKFNKIKKWFDYIDIEYKNESRLTKNHILLDDILSEIIENLYSNKRLSKIIKNDSKFPDYKRAWKIVKDENAQNIMKKFKLIK